MSHPNQHMHKVARAESWTTQRCALSPWAREHVLIRLLLGFGGMLLGWTAVAAELPWLTDLPKALGQATAEKKSVLLFFHGSDWCPTCKELERDVIKSPEFAAYARQALVLVDVDFPTKGKQSEELKKANAALRQRFNIGDNLPTLVLLNESGETVFQEAGYPGGGPKAVLPNMSGMQPKPPVLFR